MSTVRAVLLAVFAALALPAAAPAQAAPELLPDLVADPPANVGQPRVERLADGRDHLLVRFDGAVHNAGRGPLEIRGSRPAGGRMTVTAQRIYRADSSFRDDGSRNPPLRYEDTDGHGHWHLMGAARYSLWDEAGTAVAAAAKVGFCLLDSEHVDSFGPAGKVYTRSRIQYCGEGRPAAAEVFEGISPGWRDVYPADFPFQWVDVSDVAPGRYRVGADMDPDDFVIESNEANNGPAIAPSAVTVPGYLAVPVAASGTGAQALTLGAEAYGRPGPLAFEIVSAPAHGKLDLAVGVPFAAPRVVYAPDPGFAGIDGFAYSARDASTPFPLRPRAAEVTVRVPGSTSGASSPRLVAGLRFTRRGRILRVRGRAARSGVLVIVVGRRTRRLGSCRRRVRAGRRFACRIRLPRHASLRRARATVRLVVDGKRRASETVMVRRRAGRTGAS